MILSNMGYSLSISGLFHGIKSPGLEVRDRDLLAAHDHVWIQYFTVNMHAVLACMHVVCMRGKSSSNIIKIPIRWKYVEILKMPFCRHQIGNATLYETNICSHVYKVPANSSQLGLTLDDDADSLVAIDFQ